MPLSVGELNSLHAEFSHRFHEELRQILASASFLHYAFQRAALVEKFDQSFRYKPMAALFDTHASSLALALCRVWEAPLKPDFQMISIPCLVANFPDQKFLGCYGLNRGQPERALYEQLVQDPILPRLRVARTEVMAHAIQIGKSKDRARSDLHGQRGFNIVNGDAVIFAKSSAELLVRILSQMRLLTWKSADTFEHLWDESRKGSLAIWELLASE